jgi:hypothetical protein
MTRKVTRTVKGTRKDKPRTVHGSGIFVPRTVLGRRLWTIRQRILACGQPLLDWKDLETELRARQGEPE